MQGFMCNPVQFTVYSVHVSRLDARFMCNPVQCTCEYTGSKDLCVILYTVQCTCAQTRSKDLCVTLYSVHVSRLEARIYV